MKSNFYIIPIFVPHKGCPHDCIFCNQKKITGVINETKAEDVTATIESYLKTIPNDGEKKVAFYGGSFTAIPMESQNQLLSAAFEFIKAKKISSIHLSTRPDYIDEEILSNLSKYGVTTIELGVQSMDQQILKTSNRGHSAEDVEKAVKLIKEFGFKAGVQIMPGLPGDSFEKSVETARRLIELKPDIARIYPALVIKNTYMEEMYVKGEFKPLTLEEAVSISKRLLIMFEKEDIEVIRIGLQPTENLVLGNDVVAGPIHSAMRQLVEQSIFREMIQFVIGKNNLAGKENIILEANNRDISNVIGQKRVNITDIESINNIKKVKIIENKDLQQGSLIIYDEKCNYSINKKEYYQSINICDKIK